MVARLPYCAVCRIVVKPDEIVVFRADGRVQHPTCPEALCPVCGRSITPTDTSRRDGEARLHVNCWRRARAAAARDRAGQMTSLRQRIVDKLQAGMLPDDLPEKMGRGFGGGHTCDGCDDPILPAQTEWTYELGGDRMLRLHVGCAGLWQAELLRRGAKREQ